ncbi:MAG: MBL fold metallo-hydrolase [Bacteroidales bacterium]|nr:MBL fold metallo-hydrolase [Candidatus Colimorpha onthohippi]
MKKILFTLFLLSAAMTSMAFDWKPQPNEKLRTDMIAYAETVLRYAKGSAAEPIIRDFVARQKYIADEQPYAWISETHQLVETLKNMYPPKIDDKYFETQMRRHALRLLDYPLHVDNRSKDINAAELEAYNQATNTYLANSRKQVLQWLEQPAPPQGIVDICLIYNMGYLIRTSERTFAIDIRWAGTEAEAQTIAEHADCIFVSHPHGDHYTPMLLKAFEQAGKPVVLPAATLPGFTPSKPAVVIDNTILTARMVAGIEVRCLHGAQEVGVNDSVPNNVYILTFDGWTMLHQGDNENIPIQKKLIDMPVCNLIFAPAWNNIQELLRPAMEAEDADVKPMYFFPTHQNELEHVVRHRESYWELFNRKDRMGNPDFKYPPFVLMDNGESFQISK